MKFLSVLALFSVASFGFAQTPDLTPPPEAKKLDFMAGNWTGKLKFHFHQPPVEGTAEAEGKMTMGGRFMQGTNKYNMPGFGIVEGLHMITYDPATKKYKGWWFDQTTSEVMELSGDFEGTKLVMTSKLTKVPGGSEAGDVLRTTYVNKSPTEYTFLLEMKQGDKWMPLIEGTYTKK